MRPQRNPVQICFYQSWRYFLEVCEKTIAHPNDSRLLDMASQKLVHLAQRCGIALKQTYDKECTALRRGAGGYAHAKQFRRLHRVIKRQRTILGVLIREVRRKMSDVSGETLLQLQALLDLVTRVCQQKPSDKSSDKVFALHAPEVFIEQLLVLSAQQVAGTKHPGRHVGDVRWHGTQAG